MKLKLHHINLATTDVPGMNAFWRDVLGMTTEPSMGQGSLDPNVRSRVEFVTDGATQFHLTERDLGFAYRAKQALNPMERGHIAFRTDDIAAFKRRLEEKGIPYSDYGPWAVKGWQQIFFYDPAGHIIEVHQAPE